MLSVSRTGPMSAQGCVCVSIHSQSPPPHRRCLSRWLECVNTRSSPEPVSRQHLLASLSVQGLRQQPIIAHAFFVVTVGTSGCNAPIRFRVQCLRSAHAAVKRRVQFELSAAVAEIGSQTSPLPGRNQRRIEFKGGTPPPLMSTKHVFGS